MITIHSRLRIALAVAAAAAATATQAHHSFSAEFDAAKTVTVEGTVTKIRFTNPHSWIYLDVRDKGGTVTNWGFEFGTPISLRAKGLDKESILPGAHVRIDGYRARNGGAFGYSRVLTMDNGRSVQTGGAFDAPKTVASR